MKSNEIFRIYGTEYKEMTREILLAAGLEGEIKKKAAMLKKDVREMKLCIKPNLVSPSPACFGGTTHPEIVAGIIEFLQEKLFGVNAQESGGSDNIIILEGSWVGDKTAEAFEYCGYNSLSEKYGVSLVDLQKDGFYETDCRGMKIKICNAVRDMDFLINVPVLKGHAQTKVTCALKNMKGLIPNSEKRRFHTLGLHEPIAHLNTGIHQDFIVIDHICGDPDFEDGGNPLVRNCIMTAKDPVLVDTYTCKVLGYMTSEVPYITLAEKLGVGSTALENLQMITLNSFDEETENIPETRRIVEISYAVEDVDSCSACYGCLIGALDRLRSEKKLADVLNRLKNTTESQSKVANVFETNKNAPDSTKKADGRISIGQGFKGKNGRIGIGNCTAGFDKYLKGCPPTEEEIYEFLTSL